MDDANIQRFRLAVFERNTIDSLIPFDLVRSVSPQGIIGEAVAGATATMSAVSNWSRMGLEAPARPQPDEFTGWQLQTKFLRFADEVRLLRLGVAQGYYPPNSPSLVIERLMTSHFALFDLAPVVSGIFNFALEWDGEIDEMAVSTPLRRSRLPGTPVDHLAAAWADTYTSAVDECVELLVFAGSERWEQRSEQLASLAHRLAADPSLSLKPDEADDLAWGLSGAEPILEDSREAPADIQWTISCQAARGSRATDGGSRAGMLAAMRTEIAQAARQITTDERVAADLGLSRELRKLQRGTVSDES